ncbi:restriction endonuclease subunit S [Vibrio harveyi]|nr:restriction endonuclease subunit S [Vibrio harveyi]
MKLNNISKIKGGYAFKSNKFSTNGVRIIRISDFNENSIVNTSIKRYPFSNELSSYKINENDILIAMTGGTVGKSILIKRLEEDMYLNQRVCMISPIIVKPYFLHISLRSSYIQDFINRIKTSTNDNISLENIKNFLIPIPPLEEQLRIVENITKIKNLLKTL